MNRLGWAAQIIFLYNLFLAGASGQPATSVSQLLNVALLPNVLVDKRYHSGNNFCHHVVDTTSECLLQPVAFAKFKKASLLLETEHPGWKFIVYDAYRPTAVQQRLWNAVKGTPQSRYVAYPKCISLHTLGLALDVSLLDEHGAPLDMGTSFDAFIPLAQPRFEKEMLANHKLTVEQYANRLILRRIMQRAGFIQLQSEWWHYEALHQKDAHAHYKPLQ